MVIRPTSDLFRMLKSVLNAKPNQKPTQTETIWVELLLHINGRRADALLGTIGCHESIGYQ